MKALKIALVISMLSMLLMGPVLASNYHEANIDANIEVDIVTDDRGVLPQYPAARQYDGVERSYVEARDRERYSLRLRNNTSQRVGVVIAVDGRNIISGRKSYLGSNERMYILGPWEVAEYEGWRTAKNRVNRFYFTDEDDSYAAVWEDYSAMGVISVAAFAERKSKKRRKNSHDSSSIKGRRHGSSVSRGSTVSKNRSPVLAEAGTGMGEDTRSPSLKVRFKPRKYPLMEKVIRYEWRSSLCRKRVISCGEHRVRRDRNRFWPGEDWGPSYDYAPRRW